MAIIAAIIKDNEIVRRFTSEDVFDTPEAKRNQGCKYPITSAQRFVESFKDREDLTNVHIHLLEITSAQEWNIYPKIWSAGIRWVDYKP